MKDKLILVFLCALLLALPVFAEEAVATATPTPNSIAEGYVAPATPTPAPTPELPPLRDDPMLINVVEIAHRLDILAENEMFLRYSFSAVVTKEMIEGVSYGDHTRPARVYHLDGQALIAALYAGADPSQIPDFSRMELRRDLVDELPELLWGRRESVELALLSTFSRYKVFALPGAEGCGIFILLYEDASPVMVTWKAYNDCADASAFFMPDEVLAAAADAEDVSAWFAGKGLPAVAFEEVPLT